MYGYGGAYAAGDAGSERGRDLWGRNRSIFLRIPEKHRAGPGRDLREEWVEGCSGAYEGEYLLQNRIKITIYPSKICMNCAEEAGVLNVRMDKYGGNKENTIDRNYNREYYNNKEWDFPLGSLSWRCDNGSIEKLCCSS